MITIHGTRINSGKAIAEAVVLPPCGGIADIPQHIIRRGLEALRRRVTESEIPEVIVLCHSVSEGASLNLPGLKVAAIAAQSPDAATHVAVPCVSGLPDLLRDARNGDIVVVDGSRGIVYLDADVDTLVYYQSMEDHKTRRVFLESRHLPANTQDGRTILVLALASSEEEMSLALDEGADGVVRSDADRAMNPESWARCIAALGGKPLYLLSRPDDQSLLSLLTHALPGQITIASRAMDREDTRSQLQRILSRLLQEGEAPVEVGLATLVDVTDDESHQAGAAGTERLILDATSRCGQLESPLDGHQADEPPATAAQEALTAPVTVLISRSGDVTRYLAVGVDSVAVPVGSIAEAKDIIRAFPSPE